MKIANANICLDDDTLFVGEECPQCFGHSFYPLRKWLAPLHSFNEIKEKQNAKRNLSLQEKREESLWPTNFIGRVPKLEYITPGEQFKAFHAGQPTAISHCDSAESLSATVGAGHHLCGEQMESESDLVERGDRSDAGNAIYSGFHNWGIALKSAIKTIMSCGKHKNRVQDSKLLPKNEP
jgi:hypothetical protein